MGANIILVCTLINYCFFFQVAAAAALSAALVAIAPAAQAAQEAMVLAEVRNIFKTYLLAKLLAF